MQKNTLSSQRITLRPFTSSDIEAVFSYRSLEQVAKYQYWHPYSKEDAASFIKNNAGATLSLRDKWIGLLIVSKENNFTIGDCALKIKGSTAEVGFNISPKYQRQGFGKEALKLLINYAFNTAKVRQVFAITDSQNTASIKLLEDAAMQKDPSFKNQIMCKGLPSTEYKYILENPKKIQGTQRPA